MEAETIDTATSSSISKTGEEVNVVRFNDVELTFRTSDGFVNATKLCNLGGKHWKHYFELDGTKRFLTELNRTVAKATKASEGTTDLVKTNRTGNRGTWVHPRVAIDLAQWISPSFKVAVVTLVERYATGQVTTEESQAVVVAASTTDRSERPSWVSVEDQQEHHRLLREDGDERGVYVAKIAADKAKYGHVQRMFRERTGEHKRDFSDFHLCALVPTDDPLALEQYLAQDPLINENRITFETFNERTQTTKVHREIIQLNPPELTLSYIRSVLYRGLKAIRDTNRGLTIGATEVDVEMVREKELTKRTQEQEATKREQEVTKREQEKTKQMAIRLEMMRLQIEPARGSTRVPPQVELAPDVLNVEQRDVPPQSLHHRTFTSSDAERPDTAVRSQAQEPDNLQIVQDQTEETDDEDEDGDEEMDDDNNGDEDKGYTMEDAIMEAGAFWRSPCGGKIIASLPPPFLSGTIGLSACKTKVSQPDFMTLIFKEHQLKIWGKMLRDRPFVNRYTKFEKLPEGKTCHRYFPVATLPQVLNMAAKMTIKDKSYAREIDIFRTRHLPKLMKIMS